MNEFKKYPMFNSKNDLIGSAELDNVYNGGLHSTDLVILAYDLNDSPYEISAWAIDRIINFSQKNMPLTYARTK